MENASYLKMIGDGATNVPFRVSLLTLRDLGDISVDADATDDRAFRKKFHAQQQMLFLDLLIAELGAGGEGNTFFHPSVIQAIDGMYGFGSRDRCKNVEIKFRFLLLCAKSGMMEDVSGPGKEDGNAGVNGEDEGNKTNGVGVEEDPVGSNPYRKELDWFFGYHGRGSYNKPLYLALKHRGGGARTFGKAMFEKHKSFYQDTLQNTLGRVWAGVR